MKTYTSAKCIAFVLLLLSGHHAFTKDYKVLTLEDSPKNNHISFEINLGSGQGFKEVYTGFDVDDGSVAVFFPGGGGVAGVSVNYFHGNRMQYGLGYQFYSGGLNMIYDNAVSGNNRNVLVPAIRFAPVLFEKAKINIGAGLNLVMSNYLEVKAEQPHETQEALYTFKNSIGPNCLIEYQQNVNKWSGWRLGLLNSFWRYELKSFEYNNMPVDLSYAPYEMHSSKSGSLHLYFGIYVYY